MPPTSTDVRHRDWRRLLGRFGVPLLAAVVSVPLAGLVVSWGGSSGEHHASLASSVEDEAAHVAPDRASRSAIRLEEPEAAPSTTSTTVERVEVTQVTEERVIPVPKELHDDPALPRGETRVEADGSPGRERVVFEITRRNGRVTSKRQISSEIITPASPRVVFVGRGGGRGAPVDDEDIPLKLRLAQEGFDGAGDPAAGDPAGPKRRSAAAERSGSGPPPSSGQQEGGASWYRYKRGTCAHRTLPKGTVVRVTNLKTGAAADCTVADRGPFIAGRIIDLDRSVFLAIAESPGQGVLQVRITWGAPPPKDPPSS
ncbi:MAG TPA: G5 domain-containing protein [Acidimicrobiia bacterium]|nr:G5 domain-containing protein [Acidimicrobiia bacterium]